MSNCLFTTPYHYPAVIGLFLGIVIGAIFKYGTKLRNPRNADVDDTMGWAIFAVCMVLGSTLGLLVQIYMTGECSGSN